jgi:Zn-finger nucleic acid-binding protein
VTFYRDQGLPCPGCSEPLREFADRLVCDACNGMMLRVEDFSRALAGVGGLNVRVVEDTPTQRACPRCSSFMRSCRVSAGEDAIDEDILSCSHHGLWFAGGMLEAVFEQRSRKSHRGSGASGFNRGGFSSARDSLRIRRWWDKPKPTYHTPFTSALVGRELPCPACRFPLVLRGMLWTCLDHGVFVENEALAALIMEMAQQPWELPAATGGVGEQICPACTQVLATEELLGVQVDRCAQHGIWFAPTLLEAALANAGRASQPKPSWLRRFFG